MQALIQRVSEARVTVDGRVTGAIGPGLLVLLCAERGDDEAVADRLLAKLLKLRIFSDAAGKMNLSVQDVAAGCSSSASSRWRPTRRAATGRASPMPRRPSWAATCTSISSPRRALPTPRWPPANSPPTCRWRWSTTGR